MEEHRIQPFPILGVEEGVVAELDTLANHWVGDVDGRTYQGM